MENPLHARIEQYLDGTMPPDARRAFEDEVADNPGLTSELHLHETARAALQIQSLLDRRESIHRRGRQKLFWRSWWWRVQDLLEQIFAKTDANGNSNMRWGMVASAGLLLILAGYFVVKSFSDPARPLAPKPMAVPKEKAVIAFDTYYSRFDPSATLGATEPDVRYKRALEAYQSKNCAEALPNLDAVLADEKFESRATALVLKGTCLLESGDTEGAIAILRQVPPAAASLYQNAQWYTALAHLKAQRVEEGSALLREMANNPKHRRHQKAVGLLEFANEKPE
ncbi:MAG: tetratricopeptide repeat protein [Saprospiraceae bacterium]